MKTTLFILAGLGATAVTLIRAIRGGAGDLAILLEALGDHPIRGVVLINWHVLTAVFAFLAISLLVAPKLPRQAAILAGILSTLVFGTTAITFLTVSAQQTGSPFTWFPWIPLGLTALLCAGAARSASLRPN